MRRTVVGFVLGSLGCSAAQPITPAQGRVAGGDDVRIEGDELTEHGVPIVYFGVRAAKAVVVESRWLITVVTPAVEEAGVVDVAIHFDDGTIVEHAGAFTYVDQGVVLRVQ